MAHQHKNTHLAPDADGERAPYVKPSVTRVELTLEETLASGCKTETDIICTGPPSPSFDIGS